MLAAVDAPSSRRVAAEDDEVRRQAGQDHGDRPEDRAEEHDPVVAEPVGQDPEDRREDQLGDVERRGEEADDVAAHRPGRRARGAWRGRAPASRPSGRC